MGKYVFLTDIDGTLFHGRMEIPKRVVEAAVGFTGAGGLLGLCTGRTTGSTVETASRMPVNIPSVVYGGSAIYDFGIGKYIKTRSFDRNVLTSIERALKLYPKVSISVQTKNEIFLIRTNDLFTEKCIVEEFPGKVSAIDDIRGEVLKIVFASEDIDSLRSCGEECFSDYDFASSSKHFAEAVPCGSGKGTGLSDISDICNLPVSRFFMAGDAMTDLPAIKLAGFSFAPRDAPAELLEACSMTIPSCKDGGMEEAFRIATEMMH